MSDCLQERVLRIQVKRLKQSRTKARRSFEVEASAFNQKMSTKRKERVDVRTGARRGAASGAPLRVLIIAPSMDILGGQAVQAVRLLEGLRAEASLQVGFLPVNPRLPRFLRWLQAIKYVRTIVTSLCYVWLLIARVRKYDVLHIFSASYFSFVIAPTPAILVGKLYGKKIVLNYHSGEAEDHLARWSRTAIPTLRLAHAIVVQSDYLVEVFARFSLRARSIPNHLETRRLRFRQRRPLRPIFLSNRNLEPHYNVGCVLKAFALIQKQYETASLTIVGDGSQRSELEALARELNLRHTQFTGLAAPERMAELYDAAEIFLNGSEIDSMPISILEAFASGLPVVTTDAGGIPWIVADKETGLIVRRGDYQALARAALRLMSDEELAGRLTRNARSECGKYSWANVRDEWLKLYGEVARLEVSRGEGVRAETEERKAVGAEREAVGR
jgi:glycosyltransferase involved in cell wall biosynthesis